MNQKRLHEALLNVALQPRRFAKSLNQRMSGMRSHGVVAVTLDGQWLKLLQAAGPPSARRITKLLACGVEGAGPEEIQRVFQEAYATEGVAAREVLLATPTHLCTVRLFSLPSTDPKEIRDIVELQAEKHTPYAKEEILADFKILERDRAGYSRVLLVIAHQDVIRRSVRLTETSGLSLDRVGCELEGLVSWVQLLKKKAGGAAPSGASLVVDVDANTTTLLLIVRGQPQFHRSLATGAEQLAADPAQAGQRLVGELQRSLEAIDAEGGAPKIQDVLLTGRIERLNELKELINRGLAVPVTLVAPWAACEVAPSAREAAERLPDVSFAGLVGMALAPGDIDLTPVATKLRQAFEERARALIVLGCQFVAVMILMSLLLVGRAHKQHRYYEQLRRLHQESAQEASRVEEALRQIAFAKDHLNRRGQLLEAADTLAVSSTEGIQWASLTYTEGEGVVLKGSSTELPKIYELVARLDDTALFGQVEARRVARRKDGEGGVTDFEVVCPLANLTALP